MKSGASVVLEGIRSRGLHGLSGPVFIPLKPAPRGRDKPVSPRGMLNHKVLDHQSF